VHRHDSTKHGMPLVFGSLIDWFCLRKFNGKLQRNERSKVHTMIKAKGKVIPLQAPCGPEGG